ncbi:MAG TPA: type II toxin-antitoxin system VapC family toxin [Candidatus Cybelea sp.]|jgi:predicted nucleic-acid-binding protein|nr:type II toxin-antitoxin system VapC family toxin [Candidatus Cybelea sp.]
MIGLDTNVLIRYLVQDDPTQSARATAIVEKRLTPSNRGFVSTVAVVEAVWVLERVYRLTRDQVADAIERILQIDVLIVENEAEVFTAMAVLREGLGSFADAMIAALGAKAGCSHTLTFDRAALRIPSIKPA